MTEVFAPGAENPRLASSEEKPARISTDSRRDGLLREYLFAPDEKAAGDVLGRLTIDGRRAAIGGMTPRERARAAAVDELKERMPGLIRTGGVVSLSWVVGERLAEHFPNMRVVLGAGGAGLFAGGVAVETTYKLMRNNERAHPKVAALAMSLAVLRPFARLAMEIGAGISGGVVTRGVLDGFQAATEAAGAGDGGTGWEGITDRGADMGRRDSGDLRQKPEAMVGGEGGRSASLLSPSQQEFVNRAGEVAEQEARQMADAAQGAAEHQRVVEAALTPQQLTGAELTGGTVWGHEEAFVNTLSKIAHPNVATNALKNLAYGLEQGQPFTQIGPTDVVNLVNPDVGAKIAAAASDIVGREPSTLTGVDKMLWELGVLGEHATRAVAEAVIKAFANK